MKKRNIFLTLGLALAALVSCQDGNWDNEINPNFHLYNDTISEHNVISVKELKDLYNRTTKNDLYKRIKEDTQLKATVITNDKGGNLSQMLIVGDETGNIIVGILENDLYSYMAVGQEILINLQGLYIGGYGGNAQLGYPSMSAKGEERMGRMTNQTWKEHHKVIGKKELPAAKNFLEINDYDNDANLLAYAEGKFQGADGESKLAEPALADAGNSVNRMLMLDNGKMLTIRTSCYSDFGALPMPTGRVRVYGVAIPYNHNQWQLQMRTAADIVPID